MRNSLPVLSLLCVGCAPYRGPQGERPGETPVPSESAVRIMRHVQSNAQQVRLTRIILDVATSPDAYIEGRAESTAEVQALLSTLAKDPHLARIKCDWGVFQESGSTLFGLRAPLHAHRKVATLAEMRRIPAPGLAELLSAMYRHDPDGQISRLARLRMMWSTGTDYGWQVVYYEFQAEFPDRAVPLDSLLKLFEALEAHFPVLRVAHLELRLKEGMPTLAVGRLNVYVPPPPRK